MAENLAVVPELKKGQDVVLPIDKPIKETGHIQILYGNLAPEGSVAKITGRREGSRRSCSTEVTRCSSASLGTGAHGPAARGRVCGSGL